MLFLIIFMVARKSRLRHVKRRKRKQWDFVSPLGEGVGASAKLSAIGKTPALLTSMGGIKF
jgi:hypothetical protein